MRFATIPPVGRRLFAVAMLLAFGASLTGAQGRAVPLGERVRGASRVVVARARAVTARWHETPHGDRVIVSRVMLDVEETLKGAPESAVWVDIEGGTLDGVTLRVSSLPLVAPGDRAVFFLDSAGQAIYTPHGRGDGILTLDQNDVVRGTALRLSEIRGLARTMAR